MAEVSAVLFAQDHGRVARFYREALGLARVEGDESYTVLRCGDFEMVVHQVPEAYLGDRDHEEAPARRETGRIRLDFPVDSIDTARSVADRLGGCIDDAPPAWAPGNADFRLGHDPEGNVFRIVERPSEPVR